MLVLESETFVAGITGERIAEFLLTCDDERYRRWWPATHLALHLVSAGKGPGHVGDVVAMDEYVGNRRLRMTAFVEDVVPGRRIVWRLRRGIRLPARLILVLDDRPGGVAVRHTVTAGWDGPGRLADPLFRLFLGRAFPAEMDRHMRTEFRRLGELTAAGTTRPPGGTPGADPGSRESPRP